MDDAELLEGKVQSLDVDDLSFACSVLAAMEAILVHSQDMEIDSKNGWGNEWQEACSIVEPIAATALLIGNATETCEGAASVDANMQSLLRKCQQAIQGVFSLLLADHLPTIQQRNVADIVNAILRSSLLAWEPLTSPDALTSKLALAVLKRTAIDLTISNPSKGMHLEAYAKNAQTIWLKLGRF